MRKSFATDRFGTCSKIGLVYMASSTVMEPEMYAMAADGVSIHTSRLALPGVTVEGIDAMMRSPELESAVRLVAQAPVDTICFGGTSASFLHGTAWDRLLIEQMDGWARGSAITTTASTAGLAALHQVNAGPIALATPYIPEVVERADRFFSENGHVVVSSVGLSITDDHELAEVSLDTVFDLACRVDRPEATAVFISCTNLRTAGLIAALEEELRKPVVTAIQASFWHCLELADVNGAVPGYGTLLESRLVSQSRQ